MPSWTDFQRKHVLSPLEADCLSWNRVQWNNWLQRRLPSEFGRRRVNSIIIATPEAIRNDFEELIYSVGISEKIQ